MRLARWLGVAPQRAARVRATHGFEAIYPKARLDEWRAANRCPQNDRLCSEAIWMGQTMLLGPRQDMEGIAEAVRKVHASAARLAPEATG